MSKKTNVNTNQAVALITAHGWIGVSTPVVMTAKYLAKKGYLVDLFMTEDAFCKDMGIATPKFEDPNITIFKHTTNPLDNITYTTNNSFYIHSRDLEFVTKYISPPKKYVWLVGFDPGGLVRAGILSLYWKVPFIYHSLELNDVQNGDKIAEKWFSQRALLSITQDTLRADILSQLNNINREKIEVSYNSSFGEILPQKCDYFHRRFNIPKEKKIVLSTGTLLPEHGIGKIITSVHKWPAQFVLVLHGWIPDENFKSAILSVLASNAGRIFLSTEILDIEKKNIIFQSSDIGIVFFEPVSINFKFGAGSAGKLYDFMRAGVPIIGNSLPGMKELLEDNKCGIVVNDANEIGKALGVIIEQYAEFRKKSFESFYKYEFGKCYEKLLEKINSEINTIDMQLVLSERIQEKELFHNLRVTNENRRQSAASVEMVAKKKLSIVHINTHDKAGGAAKVAWRLMENQRDEGHDANMLVGSKMSNSPYSYAFPLEIDPSIQAYYRQTGQLFYECQGSHKLTNHQLVRTADILHLHNLHGGYFNPFSISALSHLKPVVWTLHDMQSITGHCAHSFDCEKWMIACGECPYLTTEPALHIDTTTQLLQDKKRIYEHSYLWVVTPSKWLKNKVERSILRNQPVELIYNGIDTNIFRPYNKKEARKIFHIPEDALVIGAVGHGGTLENQWKGGKYTQAVLEIFMARFPDCIFVNIGANSETRNPRILNVPHISSESELAQAYSTLDIFLYTSIADNCPLVVLEALSCGVPIVTFDTGGIPELVRDGVDGQVTQYKNEREIAKSLDKLASDAGLRAQYGRNARERAISKFDHKMVLEQYGKLYERCLKEHKIRSKEIKYFPISKVPKTVVTKSFLEAENAKAISQSQDAPSLNTLNREAELKIQMRDFPGAKSILLTVIERCPYNLNALNNLAIIEITEKNWESATEILKRNLEIDAVNETTLKNLKYLENRLTLHKSVLAAENLINQKDYSEAREILEKVLNIDDKYVDALNNLAVLDILEKNFESAELFLNKVLCINSTNEMANKQLDYIRQYQADNPSCATTKTDTTATIDVSIVVSTKDRAKLLDEMLTSLEKATCGVNYEIIVIEGNSSDNTLEVLHKHGIKRVYNETVYLGSGRHSWPQLYNFGFSKARGVWGMYASDDIVFNEECISKAIELLSKQTSNVAGGIFFYKNVIAEPGWDAFGIDYTYGQKLLMNYGLLRLKDFRDVNGLDEAYKFYCADGDLCFKLYEKGKLLIPLPQCLVVHNNILDTQKLSNFKDSNLDIDLYSRKWMHFVPTNKLPEPRRLLLAGASCNLLDVNGVYVSTGPSRRKEVKTLSSGSNILEQLRMSGVWTDGQPLMLHLGCGEQHLDGYINIDYPPGEHNVMKVKADVYANVAELDFPAVSVNEVRLHHVFEHFNRVTALAMLIKWQNWLRLGGKLYVETPDLIGSAKTLLAESSWKTKMGVVRHVAGDQSSHWAYHIDHWFPERFEHTLNRLGFVVVQTQSSNWSQEPFLSNVTVIAVKSENVTLTQQLKAADELLWESTVSPAEQPTFEIWRQQLRSILLDNQTIPSTRLQSTAVSGITDALKLFQQSVPGLPIDELHNFNQRDRDRWIHAKARTVAAGLRVLDIGAGTCPYKPLFSHCIYKSHDFKKYTGEKLGGTKEYGFIDYESDISAIPVPDNAFDVVLCTEVLEHTPEPIEAMREIARIVRPGGRLFMTAPLGSGLHQLPYHYYGGFTPEWYKHFGAKFGFYVTEITPNGGFFKLLAQECARVAWTLPQHQHLHGNNVEFVRNLFGEWIPRYLFALEEKHFIDQFTVGYHVEAVKVRDIDTVQKMIDKDTQNVNHYIEAARTLMNHDKFSDAIKYVEDALGLDATNPTLLGMYQQLSKYAVKSKQLYSGIQNNCGDKIYRPSFDHGKPLTLKGFAELFQKAEDALQKGAYDEAINNYKKIIEIDSASFEAYEGLAIAYTKVNQMDNAIATLEKSICLCAGDSSVFNNLGVLYFKKSMYLDARTYFEIALLANPDYKEARQNLGKVEESIKNASHTKKTNLTLGLIFSKDRAMQLDATLRSFYMHCSDAHLLDLKVIYKTSNTAHEKQYEDLKKHYGNVLFIKEDGFKEQVLSVIRKYTYVLFLVDDNIFLRNFSISDLTNNLNENKNAIGFSLRLGVNTVYCYALHSSQAPPKFTNVTSDILKYDWTLAELDFGYPLEVSSSLYRVKEIYPLLVQLQFRNPNTLEDQLAANKHTYIKTRPILLCGKLSLTFCAPLNIVQDVCHNRAGSDNCYTSNTLASKFEEGYRINIDNYNNFITNSCHQEVPLDFIRSKQ